MCHCVKCTVGVVSVDVMLIVSDVSPQVRVKILGKLSEETKGPLMKLHNCLIGKVSPLCFLSVT